MHSGFSPLRNICPMSVGVRADLIAIPPALQADIERIGELFAQGLDRFGGPWLAGAEFSAVDAFFAPVATRIATWPVATIAGFGAGVVVVLRMQGHRLAIPSAAAPATAKPDLVKGEQGYTAVCAACRRCSPNTSQTSWCWSWAGTMACAANHRRQWRTTCGK